ncbi:MAG: YhfC family intramembrane metalloprotease [Chloroflexi bacterium]|nr:YhfC family intramembrane metalloprotease [Chloroflexota bacterium]
MFFYGIVALVAGLSLLAGAWGLVVLLHRRTGAPYALLTVGILTYIAALLVQVVVLSAMDRALLGILSIGALAVGLVAGFSEEIARFLGFQYLARGADTRAHALMIGAGHGLTEALYTGLLAVGLGLSLLGYRGERPDDPGGVISSGAAEALNGVLPLIMHMALSWIVLQVFLRGAIGWLFLAVFGHAVAEILAALLGTSGDWPVVIWRVIVALIGLAILKWLRPPASPAPE